MRTIGVVTVARSDYGIYLPILRNISADQDLNLQLIVGGTHLSPEFGMTDQAILADGFPITERVEMLMSSDTPEGIAKSMGLGIMGFASCFARCQPDILLVLGDRFEMHSAALAALPFNLPVAHIHGGEITEGAMDDSLRHSITKLSHLHFVATDQYRDRVLQLGEEPWRVTVSGAPGLENLNTSQLLSAGELEDNFGIGLNPPPVLVTFHPVTLEYDQAEWQFSELLAALKELQEPVVFTMPNADTTGRAIAAMMKDFVADNPGASLVDNFGTNGYFSMMSVATAMVGNSSSGIIEAALFRLPVVNIGTRQKGRLRAGNVIDVGYERQEILNGCRKALDIDFFDSLRNIENPYWRPNTAATIVDRLKSIDLDKRLITKRFCHVGNP